MKSLLPGRPSYGRLGFFVLAVLLATACDRGAGGSAGADDRTLPVGKDTIRLDPGVTLVDVRVSTRPNEFEPATVAAGPGDVVRFTAADAGQHAIAFDAAALQPPVRQFLDSTGQLRGAPLLSAGAAWVVSLKGAPAGDYPFLCITHQRRGSLKVAG